jgi:hypothetical protein
VTTKHGIAGVFLDPPYSHLGEDYSRKEGLYSTDDTSVAGEVRQWCLEHGDDPLMRICLAGYAGEGHESLEAQGWEVVAWKAAGGYSGQRKDGVNNNKHIERLWFSPFCLKNEQASLFD